MACGDSCCGEPSTSTSIQPVSSCCESSGDRGKCCAESVSDAKPKDSPSEDDIRSSSCGAAIDSQVHRPMSNEDGGHHHSSEHDHGGDCCADEKCADECCAEEKSGSDCCEEENHGGGDCCSSPRPKPKQPATKCCGDEAECSCDDDCEIYYHNVLHDRSQCRRKKTEINARLICSRCVKGARNAGIKIPAAGARAARICYCTLTRWTGANMSKGCCQSEEEMVKEDHDSHDHDHSSVHIPFKAEIDQDLIAKANTAIVVERQPLKYAVFNVTGLTCSGCADKLAGVLKGIGGVEKDVQVNFVMARAQLRYQPDQLWDIDTQIVRYVKKRTGFEMVLLLCRDDREEEEGVVILEAVLGAKNGNQEDLKKRAEGISSIRHVQKHGNEDILVSYDPDDIGIREILAALRPELNPSSGGSGSNPLDVELRRAQDRDADARQVDKRHRHKLALETFLAFIFTVPVLVLAWCGKKLNISEKSRHSAELVLSSVVLVVAYRIYLNAFRTLRHGGAGVMGGRIDMDVLISVATLSAYVFSLAAMIMHLQDLGTTKFDPFFETSSLLVTLILVGRLTTAYVRYWALKKVRSIGNNDLRPKKGRWYDEEHNRWTTLDVNLFQYDDLIQVRRGEVVATDGIVIKGESEVDESHLTGEAEPQQRSVGSYLLAGSKIVGGQVEFRVAKLVHENTVATIQKMVAEASQQQAKVQQIADKVAAYMTPSVLALAVLVFLIWLLVGGLLLGNKWATSAITAATYAVATLAISCPCAIGLAVPMVLVVLTKIGVTKGGFILRHPAAVEQGWKVGKIIFDKTGTLTTGNLDVVSTQVKVNGVWQNSITEDITSTITYLCANNPHPVAKGMLRCAINASQLNVPARDLPKATYFVNCGLEGYLDGSFVRGGKPAWVASGAHNHALVKDLVNSSLSIFAISRDDELVAVFGLADQVRPSAINVCRLFATLDIEVFMFSGDHREAVQSVAIQLGIPVTNTRAGCSPEDKADFLKHLKAPLPTKSSTPKSKNNEAIIFVGDGTNDAIALTSADIGISMSNSTDLATSSADVMILSDSLYSVVSFLQLSKRARTAIVLNFGWCVVWNLVAILGASGAFVNVRIGPEWAGLGELASILPVLGISLLVGWGWKAAGSEKETARKSWWAKLRRP